MARPTGTAWEGQTRPPIIRLECPIATDAAGNVARQAARVLDQFGIDEDWFHLTDPRESTLPDDFDTVVTEVVSD